jgi:hypothetical protein
MIYNNVRAYVFYCLFVAFRRVLCPQKTGVATPFVKKESFDLSQFVSPKKRYCRPLTTPDEHSKLQVL